ncbi:MAG: HAMP domain-containing sensor histidine kinase [Jatrophihabitans sp.]
MSQVEERYGPPTTTLSSPVQRSVTPQRARKRRRGRRRGPRSLTSKLVFGVVTLVVLLVGIIGTATYFSLKSFLFDRLDGQLDSIASANTSQIARCLQTDDPECFLGGQRGFKAPQIEWIAVLSERALRPVVVRQNEALKSIQLSPSDGAKIRTDPGPGRTIDTVDGHHLRVSGRTLETPQGSYTIVSGLSTDEVSRTLRKLVTLEMVIGGAAVVLAMFATTFGVRFSLRRLRRVTLTAQEVSAELSPEGAGLDRRVPDDEPDTEVGQLATSFNTMLAAVETQFAARVESEERMRQFMADASHELRTPLTSIRGYAELARMQRAVGSQNEDNLDRIEFEGTRMSRLVEDLLLLARGDAKDDDWPQQRELIEVSNLVDDAVSGARAAHPERIITIENFAGDAHVVGDPDQLLRVVRNLITNAAVHTQVDRPILVRSAVDGDDVTMQVIDGGPGLPAQDAAHVFERFWRADKARTRARGGSGLGLSIVATVVRAHGGTVRFDSTVETGSTVTVRLPGVERG